MVTAGSSKTGGNAILATTTTVVVHGYRGKLKYSPGAHEVTPEVHSQNLIKAGITMKSALW
jgi:hypothetical protein